ncbi:prepilin-type N-terminal cleavage/methylation domain-containing protein [Clostridium fermenticellae]|uniref:Prepilin-type N-terminal cleavage/methylation domain-containing protein n=1 Tax=Clostridium fermenticellae TaxID=2068654 RepID=A0A386H4F9_9CLOT|nr:prepilin-type N-terminal cleavage/methylation domain-containing protein [Clostridium fermenticellae]AYD40609.1 prepilin-type N-terminal cleavage/methylation domain-containing protein [Clostridium fermenticellae]
MRFIKVNIRAKKRGFTLIELLMVTSLIGIITSAGVLCIFRYMKIYRQQINLSKENFYVDEAFLIIENEINYSQYVDVNDNCIMVRNADKNRNDYIRKDRDGDIIISYNSKYDFTNNNILKNIKDFKAEQSDRVLYLTIETKRGNIYKRCLGLERVKEKD